MSTPGREYTWMIPQPPACHANRLAGEGFVGTASARPRRRSPPAGRLAGQRSGRAIGSLVLLAQVALLGHGTAWAQVPAQRLLVVDSDAGAVSAVDAGSVFLVDVTAAATASPGTVATASAGAPFQFLAGVSVSRVDGRAFVVDPGFTRAPAVFVLTAGGGGPQVVAMGAPLVEPLDITTLPDGRLVVADADADPAGLGADDFGGPGHGAILLVDPNGGGVTSLSDGRQHPPFPGLGGAPTAFQDPVAVAFDRSRDVLFVVDARATPIAGNRGAVYAVSTATGEVLSLAASSAQFVLPASIGVRPDGRLVLVDAGASAGDSRAWLVDPDGFDPANPSANLTLLAHGVDAGVLEAVSVDPGGETWLVDSGDYDFGSNTFLVPPAVLRIDPDAADPQANLVPVNISSLLLLPVGVAAVPVPEPLLVTPSSISGATDVVIEGRDLLAAASFDFGPNLSVSNLAPVPGEPLGSAIRARLTPTGPIVVPPGCSGDLDLRVTHPWGGSHVLPAAVRLDGDDGGIVPRPACSTRGDATCDGVVDGLDLAVLGRHFGARYCDGVRFHPDADFNGDDVIDGADLAILITFFGTRP